jgi:hypothetical protein
VIIVKTPKYYLFIGENRIFTNEKEVYPDNY